MKICTLPIRILFPIAGGHVSRRVLYALAGMAMMATLAQGQQPAGNGDAPVEQKTVDEKTVQMLLQRIEQLESRVAQLEGERQQANHAASGAQATAMAPTGPTASPVLAMASMTPQEQAPTPAPPEAEPQVGNPEPERMDMSKTLMRIRGFGDINFHGSNQEGDTTSFTLGQLNLFVSSDVSEKFRFLSEIVFEAGPDNIYGVRGGENNVFSVDLERYLLQYSYNDYFNLSVGRYHTAIGYYNTAYHHSTWFQTTTGRPYLFQFEDRGGILPIHNVGASASGLIPSGRLGLHYVAEVGNGRESRTPLVSEPVQNTFDENTHKAVNLQLFARPESVRGLQFGFSAYRDLLTPLNQPKIGETILDGYVVYMVPNFEWLNEAVLVRHTPEGTGRSFNTPGFYTQISKRWGSYRPYFRYQYVNAPSSEPVFPDVGLQAGPSVGLRYDASESVAVKLQYDYNVLRNQPSVNSLGLQVGFTF
jgi:hypothetical protein